MFRARIVNQRLPLKCQRSRGKCLADTGDMACESMFQPVRWSSSTIDDITVFTRVNMCQSCSKSSSLHELSFVLESSRDICLMQLVTPLHVGGTCRFVPASQSSSLPDTAAYTSACFDSFVLKLLTPCRDGLHDAFFCVRHLGTPEAVWIRRLSTSSCCPRIGRSWPLAQNRASQKQADCPRIHLDSRRQDTSFKVFTFVCWLCLWLWPWV